MSLRTRPLPTEVFDSASEFLPEVGAAYIHCHSVEDRSGHIDAWAENAETVTYLEVLEESMSAFRLVVDGNEKKFSLRSEKSLRQFWEETTALCSYLDITGLPHHIWAPLLKAALLNKKQLRVVYAEPADYRFHPAPRPEEIFDLSEKINGIAPIPGFASLTDEPDEASAILVPLLGFEGARFSYILEQVQPQGDKVIPVIGAPGFRPEYPFHAYQGNQRPLSDTGSWKNVRYAIANCPFSVYYTLEDVAKEYADVRMKIALIGTKPHALGAVLFSMSGYESVEIVYDHPIRKAKRTSGSARILVYHVSDFAGG